MGLLRKSDPQMPIDPFTAEDLVPPAVVAQIDQFLADLGNRHSLGAAEVRDLLLDLRNVIWRPTVHSAAVGPLLASRPAKTG